MFHLKTSVGFPQRFEEWQVIVCISFGKFTGKMQAWASRGEEDMGA
jgi:hypothetical protein